MLNEKLKNLFKMSSENYDTLSGRCKKCNIRKIIYIILIVVLILALIAFLTAFVVIPIAFMLSFSFQDALMFTRFGLPSDPEQFNLTYLAGLDNFYVDVSDLETNDTIKLGAWHLLPWGLVSESITDPYFNYNDALRNSSYQVVIYFHGAGETRRDSYNLYAILRIFFHVITFDYRSYGDSSRGHMSEDAVVNDCVQFVKWVRSRTDSEVFIWGQSLGTSLATSAIARLKDSNVVPTGVVLVAPFTTMREEIPVHPYGRIFAWLPWFEATMLDPLYHNGFRFENTRHILEVDSPIMVLSAEDDSVVPYTLGKKLVAIARIHRNETQGNITFYQIPAKYGCDHFWIYLDPDLPFTIWRFLSAINSTENSPRYVTESTWQTTSA